MTLNHYDDNETLWSGDINVLSNALAGEAIVSGCAISKGSGDWDTDVASGTVIVGNSEVSVSAGTVTHTAPSNDADMDAGESRVDLVTVDSTDTLAITEGTAASNPTTPDVPSGEVVLGFWHIANSDSTLADSDRFDTPALLGDDSARYLEGGSHVFDSAKLPVSQDTFNGDIYTVIDDFADNKLTGRDDPSTTASEFSGTVGQLFRPEYRTVSGSPSASNSALQLPDGSTTGQQVACSYPGLFQEVTATFSLDSTNSSGDALIVYVCLPSGAAAGGPSDGYLLSVGTDGNLNLYERTSNTNTALATGTWSPDTSQHTVTSRRTGTNWEMLFDGTSQGTATDTTHEHTWELAFRNVSADPVNVHQFTAI